MDGGEQPTQPGPQDWVYHVAAQLAATDLPSRGETSPPRKPRRGLLALFAVAAVAVAAIVVVVLTRGGDDKVETSAATTSTAAPSTLATIATTAVAATSLPASVTTVAPTTVAPSTTSAPTTTASLDPSTTAPAPTTVAVTPDTTDPNAPPVRWAEFADGVVTLKGRVPDQATADDIAGKAAAVVGAANVHVEYVIDPTAPKPDFAPLYVNNSILFEPGFALLNTKARATLDLAVNLLTLYPKVTFDIRGYTDSDGTEAENLALSQRRVDAIVKYLVDRGIDQSRLSAVAKGEADPIADNATPEGRAQNRRIEIQVNGLLG